MANYSAVTERWAAIASGQSKHGRQLRNPRMPAYDDAIYSYGRHFELARPLKDRKGRTYAFLLNGDRYSVTTAKHQREIRAGVATTGLPAIIVPYSALDAAGIFRDTIRPLEVLPDRMIEHRDYTDADLSAELIVWGPAHESNPGERWNVISRTGHWPEAPEYKAVQYLRGYDYGERAFVERDLDTAEFRRYTKAGNAVDYDPARKQWYRPWWRHFLGASLFSAYVARSKARRKYLSAFDDQERRPLYFLAELPRTSASTVAEALDALAPRAVHAALAQGRKVVRQGDIFAVPTSLSTRDVKQRTRSQLVKGAHLLGTNHTATEVAAKGRLVYARGTLRHDPGAWREPDHARRKMGDGKTWHLIVQNTVPRR